MEARVVKLQVVQQSNFERIEQMRRDWAPRSMFIASAELYVEEVPLVERQLCQVEVAGGVKLQRCGGGYRVLRKRIGGD